MLTLSTPLKYSIQLIKRDSYNINRHFTSSYFVEYGIRLRIDQSHNQSNGMGFIINPSTLLSGEYQPVKLWVPTPEAVEGMLKGLLPILKELGLSHIDVEKLSLSEMDLTENSRLGKKYDPGFAIYCCHKGCIPRSFQEIKYKNKDEAEDFFAIKTNRISVKVYDKIYELRQSERCPDSLKDKNILRFEVSMKREAFLKKLGLARNASLYEMLRSGYKQGPNILDDYWKKILPCRGQVVPYRAAKELIQQKVTNEYLQEQMLFLLKKTSDSARVSAAVQKLEDHYTDVDTRRIKKIFAKFDELEISPITLPKNHS